jgi:hypothetical protein
MVEVEHTHEDGTTHSHEGGAVPHTHETVHRSDGCNCTPPKRSRSCVQHG